MENLIDKQTGEDEMMEDAFADLRGAVILGGATPGPW